MKLNKKGIEREKLLLLILTIIFAIAAFYIFFGVIKPALWPTT